MRRRAVTLLLFLCAACPDRDPRWTDAAIVDGPFSAGGKLFYVNRGSGRLIALDPASGAVSATVLVDSIRAVGFTGADVLAIGGTGQSPKLVIAPASGAAVREVTLPGAYDRIEAAQDGLHALALYDPRVTPAAGAPAARNANEVAVIDVAGGSARRVVLETESLAPRAVLFDPSGGLAAVLLDSAVALVDVSANGGTLRVPLELPGGARLTPERALFSPDGRFLYVLAAGASDVLALEIVRSAGKVDASINFLSISGGERAKDIAIAGTGAAFGGSVAALFARGGNTVAALLDATGDISKTRAVTMDVQLDRLAVLGEGLLLIHGSPDRRAVIGSPYFAAWEPLQERVDLSQLSGPTYGPVHAGGGVAFFDHRAADGSSAAAITAVKVESTEGALRTRSSPVVIGGDLTAIAGDAARGEIYLGVAVARRDSGAAPLETGDDDFSSTTGSLVVVRGSALDITAIALDQVISGLGVVGDVVWATHPASAGDVTFLPRDDLRRERARRSDGFLLAGILEEVER